MKMLPPLNPAEEARLALKRIGVPDADTLSEDEIRGLVSAILGSFATFLRAAAMTFKLTPEGVLHLQAALAEIPLDSPQDFDVVLFLIRRLAGEERRAASSDQTAT